jgi:hypothetical protein
MTLLLLLLLVVLPKLVIRLSSERRDFSAFSPSVCAR